MPNFWPPTYSKRYNSFPSDSRTDGLCIATRITLNEAKPGVHYKYVIDEDGMLWLIDNDDRVYKHNSMILYKAGVFSAGWLQMDGSGIVDCTSGHYMAEDPLVYEDEIETWYTAVSQTIKHFGKIPGRLDPFPVWRGLKTIG